MIPVHETGQDYLQVNLPICQQLEHKHKFAEVLWLKKPESYKKIDWGSWIDAIEKDIAEFLSQNSYKKLEFFASHGMFLFFV